MAFTEGASTGTTSGASNVTAVSAPSSGSRRIVRHISVFNADTASATVSLKYYDGTNERIITKVTLAVGDTLIFDVPIVLNTTSTIVRLALAGAVSTTELPYTAHYATVS